MVLINPSKLGQDFVAPVAKSHLQRELLLSLCSSQESLLVGNFAQIPDDVLHALGVIETLGCTVDRSDWEWKITPPKLKQQFERIELHVEDNGKGLDGRAPKSLQRRARLLGGRISAEQGDAGGSSIRLVLRRPRPSIFSKTKKTTP